MWCPKCADEYRPGFVHCPDCDVDLVEVRPVRQVAKRATAVVDSGLVEYPLDDYSEEQVRLLEFMLKGAGMHFSWESPQRLIVGLSCADEVDEILDFVDAGEDAPAQLPSPPAEPEIESVKRASRLRRFIGSYIDALAFAFVALPLRHVGWGTPLLLWLAYETTATALWGKTLGKFVFRIRVAMLADGSRPTWSAAAIRAVVPALATIVIRTIEVVGELPLVLYALVTLVWFLAVYLPVFSVDRLGLHDRAAGTVVLADDR